MDTPSAEKTDRKQRHRSPSYPADGLDSCIQLARKIYSSEKKAVISTEMAVKHMGFSGIKSGSARVTLSSLKKFGLLTDEGSERVRVTDDAVKLFFAPDDATKLPILRSLALKPEIIKDLLSEYKDGLPSDDSLKYRLVSDRGFGEAAADAFIRAFRETVRLARLDPSEYTDPSEAMAQESNNSVGEDRPQPANDGFRRPGFQFIPATPKGVSVSKQHAELSDGTQVDLQISGPLNEEAAEELLQYIDIWTKSIKKRSRLTSEKPKES